MSLTFVVVSVVVVIGLGSWYLVTVRRSRHDDQFVGGAWLNAHKYKRSGDVPPGTNRQEEGR